MRCVGASVPLVPLDTKRGGRGRGSRSLNGVVGPRRRSGRAARSCRADPRADLMDDILHGSGGAKDNAPTQPARTDAPPILPERADTWAARQDYKDLLISWANKAGYGFLMRDETPLYLMKYRQRDVESDYTACRRRWRAAWQPFELREVRLIKVALVKRAQGGSAWVGLQHGERHMRIFR
eukprot:scaffold2678_cov140-Isochrysis_galbana.AAC.5